MAQKKRKRVKQLTLKTIFIQAVATSIDALSFWLTFSDYSTKDALICCLIVAIVTFICSFIAIMLGKKFGMKFENKAVIASGIILIIIGLEIFITSFL